MPGATHLNSPLLLLMRSGAQYLAEVSSTTMWTVLVVLPLLVLTRHSQFPVKPGWMLEMVRALVGSREGGGRKAEEARPGGGGGTGLGLPGDQRAVLHHAPLDGDALGRVRRHHAAILVPEHLHVLGHERGLALERQAVPLEDHLPLGRGQLEGRQLQRGV